MAASTFRESQAGGGKEGKGGEYDYENEYD